jgi:hypothetical protein
LFGLAVAYGLNLLSPLRLNTDALVLLSMALSAAAGHGYLVDAHSAVYPQGYPWMVSLLVAQGWASPASLMLLNLCWLGLGIFSVVQLFRDAFGVSRIVSVLLCALVLLNWIVIKHAALPLTDVPFFGAAMLALMLCERGRIAGSDLQAVAIFLCAWLVVLAAIAIRRPGIALLPPLIWAIATRQKWLKQYAFSGIWQRIVASLVLVSIAFITVAWIYAMSTLHDYSVPRSVTGITDLVLSTSSYRLVEIGEIMLNVPSAKLPVSIKPLITLVGFAGLSVAIFGAILQRRLGTIEVFCLCYMGILILWPFMDSRFLIPVLPFLIGYGFLVAANTGARVGHWKPHLAALAMTPYLFAGGAALAYNARLSTSAGAFPNLYGDGNLRPTYCYYLGSCPAGDPQKIDQKALRILQAFNPS